MISPLTKNEETKPDAVIITTPDCYHDFYAIKAMRTCVADIKNRARIKEAMICTQKFSKLWWRFISFNSCSVL